MSHFLEKLDKIYNETLERSKLTYKIDENFTIYQDVTPIAPKVNFGTIFKLKKRKRSSLLLVKVLDSKQVSLYFSEYDVIVMLIYIYDNLNEYGKYICKEMINLIKGMGCLFTFSIDKDIYKANGIKYIDNDVSFLTIKDYEIYINDLIFLLNIIIEKDRFSKKNDNEKITLIKYLLFTYLFSEKSNKKYEHNIINAFKGENIYKGKSIKNYKGILNKTGREKLYFDTSLIDLVCDIIKEEES
ncbi:hypothetical protein E5N06_08810 [Clostridium perfringens]|nr:hypothetical protein [Clostridium perfringens]